MPAIGISDLDGFTQPAGCFLEELSRDVSVEKRTIKDKAGVTKYADTLGFKKTTRSAKGRGNLDLAAVTAGAFTAGTYKVTSIKNGQKNDDYSTFEETAVKYENLA